MKNHPSASSAKRRKPDTAAAYAQINCGSRPQGAAAAPAARSAKPMLHLPAGKRSLGAVGQAAYARLNANAAADADIDFGVVMAPVVRP